MAFVVLPELKNDVAMLDSTYPTVKTREEQQQMRAKLLFYQSTKEMKLKDFHLLFYTYQVNNPKHNIDFHHQFSDKTAAKTSP